MSDFYTDLESLKYSEQSKEERQLIEDALTLLDGHLQGKDETQQLLTVSALVIPLMGATLGLALRDNRYLLNATIEKLCERITEASEETFSNLDNGAFAHQATTSDSPQLIIGGAINPKLKIVR